ncbi:hypothetical protein [Marinibacterium profundimaris]|uniref:hypothetical protein n=1 Tax=Marinibacterium profundimaris TaxID=1679460 RepID=UPI001E5E97CB|nr:hypothetical protein [Marinibacterium profundimaris]
MLKFLRVSVSAFALSTLAVAPLATITMSQAAFADNNGNGGGNGGGNGNGGNGGGNGRGNGHGGEHGNGNGAGRGNSGKGQSRGNSGHGSASVGDELRSLGRNLKANGVAGLFAPKGSDRSRATAGTPGNGHGRQGTVKQVSRMAPETSVRPVAPSVAIDPDVTLPRNAGKLTGALNSSPRAKQAHIANGSYLSGSGPVSLAAALAVADYNLASTADAYDSYQAAQSTIDLARAFNLVGNSPTAAQIDAAQAVLADPSATREQRLAAQEVLDYPDTSAAEALIAGMERPTRSEVLDAREVIAIGSPSEEDLLAAALSVRGAESSVLSAYKGSLPAEDENDLLSAVRASNPDAGTVADALGVATVGANYDYYDGYRFDRDDEVIFLGGDRVIVLDNDDVIYVPTN